MFPIILFLFGTPVMANPRIGNLGIDALKQVHSLDDDWSKKIYVSL